MFGAALDKSYAWTGVR